MESREIKMTIAAFALLCAGMAIGYIYSQKLQEVEVLKLQLELEKQKSESKTEEEPKTDEPPQLPKKETPEFGREQNRGTA